MDDAARDVLRWAEDALRERTRGRILDLGCGEGRFLPPGGVGIDRDADRLTAARGRSPLVVRADAHALPFRPGTFDTAYAHRMLNDAGSIDDVLAEIARVLRPTGRLLVFTRARSEAGDRLDRRNGHARLRPFFDRIEAITHPSDERAAIFIAEAPRAGRAAIR